MSDMRYRVLGRSGMSVSEICLGTMNFGGPTDETESRRIIDDAGAHGVNFIDTADVYTDGRSEEICGRAVRGKRDAWIVATKVGNIYRGSDAEGGTGGLSRRWMTIAAERSLKRLGLDVIDIYYVHRVDPKTPWDDIIATFGDLIRSGKIRYWGLSNVRAWHIAEIAHLCRAQNVPQPVVLQPYYNLLNRQPETEVLPAAHNYQLGVVPYSPVARGVLSGKYKLNVAPAADSRAARQDRRMMETEWRPESLAIAETLRAHAERKGATLVDFALAWVLNNRAVTSVIAGPRTFEQWTSYLSGLRFTWTAEDEALVNGLVTTGHPSTPGYNDPSYPIEGRLPLVG
jgi:aryl-alcohol dehydrogenase-like predicted oxidoreductase